MPAHKLIQPGSGLVPGPNRSPESQALAVPSPACTFAFSPGGGKPACGKAAVFYQGSGSAQSPPKAPTPGFSMLRCQELNLSNLEPQIKCQTIAFPWWKDLGRRERGTVERCAS